MFQNLTQSITLTALLGGGILALPGAAGEPNSARVIAVAQMSQTQELRPFTHVARIPAGSDPATIRLEKIRSVTVPISVQYTADATYCREAALRDPGGSIYCPEAHITGAVAALEATYSYTGQPLASDEHPTGRSTFQVYFRPNEVAPEVRTSIENGKRNAKYLAEYFLLNAHLELVQRNVIDESQSTLCAGNFVDGNWTHTDPACRDRITYKTANAPSGYLTVKVDPVARLSAQAK